MLLSRSGKMEKLEAALETLENPGWAACVTSQKCDITFAEDAAFALGTDPSQGRRK